LPASGNFAFATENKIGRNEMNRAVFLDRDGVINRAVVKNGRPFPPATIKEVELLPEVKHSLGALSDAGYLLIVVTNQPDVARGVTPRHVVEEINRHLGKSLPITEFYTCYHDNDDDCDCRKPKPGALLTAARNHQIDLQNSYMIGDRWRDMEAGDRAGCKTIFVDYGYREKQPDTVSHRVTSTGEAAQIILEETT
jgi:D-glycero-D-manno-heptose 1,7-bisphosphate phosphatase